jgi:hypothetical protein
VSSKSPVTLSARVRTDLVDVLLGVADVLAERVQAVLHVVAAVPGRRLLHAASVPRRGLA